MVLRRHRECPLHRDQADKIASRDPKPLVHVEPKEEPANGHGNASHADAAFRAMTLKS